MENEKNFEDEMTEEDDLQGDTTSRARNRTVMLTPEITGEVRARLAQDLAAPQASEPQAPPVAPASGSSYSPASSEPAPHMSGGAPIAPAHTFQEPSPASTHAVSRSGERVAWGKVSPIIGFLVSYDMDENGAVFELRTGRLIVTSEAPGAGNYLVVNDDTVSPMHAIMRITQDAEIQVLDQLSEFGTRIQRAGSEDQEELSGDKGVLGHGDLIMFGERKFHVCIVAR